jgi:hypothetical protein
MLRRADDRFAAADDHQADKPKVAVVYTASFAQFRSRLALTKIYQYRFV